jgi:hypothetical protein
MSHDPTCSRGREGAPRRVRLAISDDRSAERSIANQLFDVSTACSASQRRTACSACGRRSCTKTATACTHSSASRKACAAQSQSGSQRLRVCTKYWPPDGEYTRYSPGAHWRTTHRHAFGNRAAGTGAQVHGVGIGGDLHARGAAIAVRAHQRHLATGKLARPSRWTHIRSAGLGRTKHVASQSNARSVSSPGPSCARSWGIRARFSECDTRVSSWPWRDS